MKNETPSYAVYEDSSVRAFLEIRPISEGHVLVIPKYHAKTIYELEEEDYSMLMSAVKRIGGVLQKAFSPKRVGVLVYGFDVEHAHVHLIPLYNGEELTLNHGDAPSEEVFRGVVARIANAL